MKHIKLFETINEYNTWLNSNNFITPYIVKNKETKIVSYQKKQKYYDAEIEYLESTGTQYIDTNIIPNENTGIRIYSIHGNYTDKYAVGLRNNTNATRWCIGHKDHEWYCGYGDVIYIFNTINDGINEYEEKQRIVTDLCEISLNYMNNKKAKVYNLMSTNTYEVNLPELSFIPSYTIRLFGTSGVNATYTKWDGKIYGVKISQGTNLIMDLIPVRKDGVGYMFDKVTKRLFGNNGTGTFILGPDIA